MDVAIRNAGNTAWTDIEDMFRWDADNEIWVPFYQRDTVRFGYWHFTLEEVTFYFEDGNVLTGSLAGITVERVYPTADVISYSGGNISGNSITLSNVVDGGLDHLIYLVYDSGPGNLALDGIPVPSFRHRLRIGP